MLTLKYTLIAAAALFVMAASIAVLDLSAAFALHRPRRVTACSRGTAGGAGPQIRWRTSVALVLVAWMPLLMALGIAVVRSREPGLPQRNPPPLTKSAGKLSSRNPWRMVLPGDKFFYTGEVFHPTAADTRNRVRQEMHREEQE
jgi:hypothetical protein